MRSDSAPSAIDVQDVAGRPGALPTVSVVIPTRERPELLRRAVAAVLGQDYGGTIECIVVFDRSEVALPELPTRRRRRVIGIENDRTPGLAGARNSGALAASGDLLASCDDDDMWLADKLRRQVDRLESEAGAIAVGSGILLKTRGRVIRRVPDVDRVLLADLLRSRRMEVHSSNLLVRRSDFIERVGLIDEQLPNGQDEDYDWILRAARLGPILVVREPLVVVDWQPRSWFSERWETMVQAHLRLLERHPEFRRDPRGLARIHGQIAFYEAAAGNRRSAVRWAVRALGSSLRERRAYLALIVCAHLVSARRLVAWANRLGRGI